MKTKDVIKGIEEGFDDNEQIAGAVEWVEDSASRLADFEQDNHMQAIKIKKMQAEIDALKVGHSRYEKLRGLNVLQFRTIFLQNLKTGTPFDDLVDALGGAK